MTAETRSPRLLSDLVGGWRTQLVFRAMGLASLQWVLAQLRGEDLLGLSYIGVHTLSEWILAFVWIGILVLGARVGYLTAALLCSVWVLAESFSNPLVGPLAERGLQALIPLYALIAYFTYRRRGGLGEGEMDDGEASRMRLENSIIAFIRVAALIGTAFTAIHKMNADFLTADLSCFNLVAQRLLDWGEPGAFASKLGSPGLVIVLEASMPLLLWFKPLLGIAHVAVFMTILRMASFIHITMFVTALSLAFFEQGDRKLLEQNRKLGLRIFGVILLSYAALFAILPNESGIKLIEIALHGVVVSALGSAVLTLLWVRGEWPNQLSFWRPPRRAWPRDRFNRAMLTGFSLFLLIDCMSPYFGYRFEYSFAMFSNLRADEQRWNSYVFPRWMHVVDHPYVSVERSDFYFDPPMVVRVGDILPTYALARGEMIRFQKDGVSHEAGDFEAFIDILGISRGDLEAPTAEFARTLRSLVRVEFIGTAAMGPKLPQKGMVEPGMLRTLVATLWDEDELTGRYAVDFVFEDRRVVLEDAGRGSELEAWLEALPPGSPFFRRVLSGGEPQSCVH